MKVTYLHEWTTAEKAMLERRRVEYLSCGALLCEAHGFVPAQWDEKGILVSPSPSIPPPEPPKP